MSSKATQGKGKVGRARPAVGFQGKTRLREAREGKSKERLAGQSRDRLKT